MKNPEKAHVLGAAFRAGLAFANGHQLAQDAARWITVFPNGRQNDGRPAIIDSETGKVLGGMGGKFNGENIQSVRKEFRQTKPQKALSKAEIRAFAEKPEAKAVIDRLLKKHSRNDIVDELAAKAGVNITNQGSANLAATEYVMGVGVDKVRQMLDESDSRSGRAKKAAETRRKNASEKAASQLEAAKKALETTAVPDNFGRVSAPVKIKKETEKAVQIDSGNGFNVWLPKSQVKVFDGKYVIAMSDWVGKKHGIELSMSKAHEDNLKAYRERKIAEQREQARQANENFSRAASEASARKAQEEKDYLQKNGLRKTKLPSSAAFKGNQVTIGGSAYRVAEIHGGTRINADDPSIHGSHLLGEEDTAGKWVYLKPTKGS